MNILLEKMGNCLLFQRVSLSSPRLASNSWPSCHSFPLQVLVGKHSSQTYHIKPEALFISSHRATCSSFLSSATLLSHCKNKTKNKNKKTGGGGRQGTFLGNPGKSNYRVRKITLWVKAVVTKADKPSSNPGTNTVEGENQPFQAMPWPPHVPSCACTGIHMDTFMPTHNFFLMWGKLHLYRKPKKNVCNQLVSFL